MSDLLDAPLLDPYNQGLLKVSGGHEIWYGETGNPDGIPVVSLHGSLGSQSKPKHADSFDLGKVRFIQIDQRGCGQSLPLGSIENNTTQDLIADIEAVREHLGIDQWFVTGSSWGTTLALLYAEAHSAAVKGLCLKSVFLGRSADVKWISSSDGALKIFPDLWEVRKSHPDQDTLFDVLLDYAKTDTEKRKATKVLYDWEGNLMYLSTDFRFTDLEEINEYDLGSARVFAHYEKNHHFIEEGQILKNVNTLKDVPAMIVHGRYDMICPVEQAYTLHKALPLSQLEIVNHEGHGFRREGNQIAKLLFGQLFQPNSSL